MPPSLLLLAGPLPAHYPTPDTAREALHFRSSPLGAAELPKCCVAALFQTQTSTSRAQPLPHSSISASSALSGVPSSPSPHTPPRSQGGSSFNLGGQRLETPSPRHFFCDQGGCPKWPPTPGQAWLPHDVLSNGGHIGLGASPRPYTRLDTEGLPKALAPPPTPSHQLLLALCGCASHLPPPRG